VTDTAPRMPIKTRLFQMEGDYAAFHAVMRVNISMTTLAALYSDEDVLTTLASLVQEWNFADENGVPIVPDIDGLRSCPFDLVRMLKEKYAEALRSPLPATTSPESLKP
jgi:hypothetical protein